MVKHIAKRRVRSQGIDARREAVHPHLRLQDSRRRCPRALVQQPPDHATSHRPAVYSGRDRGRVLNMPQEGVVERIVEQIVDMSGPEEAGEDHQECSNSGNKV